MIFEAISSIIRQTSVNKDTIGYFLKNPLGLIGLIATIFETIAVIVFSTGINNLHVNLERQPIIWFIVGFPIIVLGVIAYLIICHHLKLYAPADYNNDASFLAANQKAINIEKRREARLVGLTNPASEPESPNDRVMNIIAKSEAIGLVDASNYFGVSLRKKVSLNKKKVSNIIFDGMAFKGNILCVAEVKLISENNWAVVLSQYFSKMASNVSELGKAGYNIDALLILVPKGELSQQTQMGIEEKFYSVSRNFGLIISKQSVSE